MIDVMLRCNGARPSPGNMHGGKAAVIGTRDVTFGTGFGGGSIPSASARSNSFCRMARCFFFDLCFSCLSLAYLAPRTILFAICDVCWPMVGAEPPRLGPSSSFSRSRFPMAMLKCDCCAIQPGKFTGVLPAVRRITQLNPALQRDHYSLECVCICDNEWLPLWVPLPLIRGRRCALATNRRQQVLPTHVKYIQYAIQAR
jgi:hypothetical protein